MIYVDLDNTLVCVRERDVAAQQRAISARADAIKAQAENAKLREALEFIVKHGGMTHDSECGEIKCTGFWCAEQARSALST